MEQDASAWFQAPHRPAPSPERWRLSSRRRNRRRARSGAQADARTGAGPADPTPSGQASRPRDVWMSCRRGSRGPAARNTVSVQSTQCTPSGDSVSWPGHVRSLPRRSREPYSDAAFDVTLGGVRDFARELFVDWATLDDVVDAFEPESYPPSTSRGVVHRRRRLEPCQWVHAATASLASVLQWC